MEHQWIHEYANSLCGVSEDYKEEWDANRFMVHNKMFAMKCSNKQGKPILTLKVEPLYSEQLRGEYTDIVPGYYMNKQHWISIYLNGSLSESFIKNIIKDSYITLVQTLPKKIQLEINKID